MKRKKKKFIENLEISRYAAEGKGLGYTDGKVVFVKDAMPGDVGKVVLDRNRKAFAEGRWVQLTSPSSERIEPFCHHFDLCGGCKWQYAPYAKQLEFKEQEVVQNLRRIGKSEDFKMNPIMGSPKTSEYRNKLEFTFSATRWLSQEEIQQEDSIDRRGVGFHIPGKFDRIVDVTKCHLMDDENNVVRNELRKLAQEHNLTFYHIREHHGLLRNLVIRKSRLGELLVMVIFGEDHDEHIQLVMNHLKNHFPSIDSLSYIINLKKNDSYYDQKVIYFHGNQYIMEKLTREDGTHMTFEISPKSFFQTNTSQAENLYKRALNMASFNGDELVYDLYCGTGTIGLFAAPLVKKVIGLEFMEDAVRDAFKNASDNKIENIDFYSGDIKDMLNSDFYASHGTPDIIITDPPRAGMHPDVVEAITSSGAEKIVYISCNSATQARDIALMKGMYSLKEIQPADMFPHTHHVENIALLTMDKYE